MTKKFLVRLAPAVLLFAAACGGGGDGSSDGGSADGGSSLKEAVSTAFVDNIESDGVDFKADKVLGDCVADSLLADAKYQPNLQKAFDDGLTGQDLLDSAGDTESDVEISRKIFTCFSSEQLAILLSAQLPSADGSSEEARQCLTEEFDAVEKDVLVDGIFELNGLGESSGGASTITEAISSCFGVDALGEQ